MGVYEYKTGAVYAGEWNSNMKHGYGVYKYQKGGCYAGEWVAGRPQGAGVRTKRTGKQTAGLWQVDLKLKKRFFDVLADMFTMLRTKKDKYMLYFCSTYVVFHNDS